MNTCMALSQKLFFFLLFPSCFSLFYYYFLSLLFFLFFNVHISTLFPFIKQPTKKALKHLHTIGVLFGEMPLVVD